MSNTPKEIGKYKIECLVAEGGMGAVYKGKHPTLNRDVILKKLTFNKNSQFIERFMREAKIMMDFKNDNIVDVYDHFKEGNSYYIVLEYIDGISLDKLIKEEGTLSNDMALYIVMEIAKALKYAHDKGVVHRDIKPANILISKSGEIKLVDFGIAAKENDEGEDLTTIGMTLGTPSYMSPEQFENTKNVDKRTDIYSLGVMLYEMITGRKPFPGGLTPDNIVRIQKGKYTNPKKLNSSCSGFVTKLIKKMMYPKVDKRIKDLGIIISKLRKYFKREKLDNYKNRLSSLIDGDQTVQVPPTVKHSKILPVIGIILLVVISLTALYIKWGYEVIHRSTHGAVILKLEVSKNYYKQFDEIYIKSKFFKEKGTQLNYIENSDYELIYKPELSSEYYVYESNTIYLPKGFYRLKLIVDGNLFWENINLHSRVEQKMNPESENGQVLVLTHKEPEPLPFNPVLTVRDQLTGKDLTETATIYIQKNKKFEKFKKNDKSLKTGTIQYFQFSDKGYYPKDYILQISADQTDLKLDAEIYPKPGVITIDAKIDGLNIKLNNKTFYIKGDRSEEKIKLGKSSIGKTELILNPGEYKIQFSYKWNNIEKTFKVESNKEQSFTINYNKDSKSLIIE